MNEEQPRQIEALLDLYKQQMEHYHHTQQVEWKANFGVWTLLAGAIYILPTKGVHVPHCASLIAPLITAAALMLTGHAYWLYKIHSSEVWDKVFWTRYRYEALRLIRSNGTVNEDEKEWNRNRKEKLVWLGLEVMITFLLCSVLLWVTLAK
jgi:hypothetical protein